MARKDDEVDDSTGDQEQLAPRRGAFTRLQFLKGSATVLAGLGITATVVGCESTSPPAQPQLALDDVDSMAQKYNDVPAPPTSPPPQGVYHVFSPDEAAMVDALTSRIVPSSPGDPGAHEASVVTYIDQTLAWHEGNAEPTYIKPPFAMTYKGDTPPANDTVNGVKVIWVKESEIDRYGVQGMHTPKDTYRLGLQTIDQYTQKQYGQKFVDLSEQQQDAVIHLLAAGNVPGFKTSHDCASFFALLRTHTIEGLFSDPLYGGNRNMVGWAMVKYPGIHRAYTPADIHNEHFKAPRQGMADLMPENPGQPSPPYTGILPISGSAQQQQT